MRVTFARVSRMLLLAMTMLIALVGCRHEARYFRCRACRTDPPAPCGEYFPTATDYATPGALNQSVEQAQYQARLLLCSALAARDGGRDEPCFLLSPDHFRHECTSRIGPTGFVPIH